MISVLELSVKTHQGLGSLEYCRDHRIVGQAAGVVLDPIEAHLKLSVERGSCYHLTGVAVEGIDAQSRAIVSGPRPDGAGGERAVITLMPAQVVSPDIAGTTLRTSLNGV